MPCEQCEALGIPEKLCKNGRPNVDYFSKEEYLYRRHTIKGTEADIKELSPAEVADNLFVIHDDSYNRSSLSDAEDVLLNDNPDFAKDIYDRYGIIKINVGELHSTATHKINGDARTFSLKPIHDPKECNYAHSEIHCYVDGSKAQKKPKSINSVFRQILITLFTCVKEAS